MTAASALAPPRVRRRIADAAHASDVTVKAFLRGFPSAQKQEDLLAAALAAGVDLATIPARTAEEIAEHRRKRNPGQGENARIARLVEAVAAERARAEKAETRVLQLERRMPERCPECHGKGGSWDDEAIDQWYDCGECDGTGHAPTAETLRLRERVDELEASLEQWRGSEAWAIERVAELEAQLATRESGGPCVYCGRERARDSTSPTNLYCGGCKDRGYATVEAKRNQLAGHVKELEKQLASAQARAYPVGTVAAIDAEDALAMERLEAGLRAAGMEDDETNRDWDVTVADGLDEEGHEIDRLEGFAPPAPEVPERAVPAEAPTPALVPLRRTKSERKPVVTLEGFPPEALAPEPPAESGYHDLLSRVDDAAHG